MSIHVCKCEHSGKTEYHLRYPGVNQDEAQGLADQINGGAILALRPAQAGDRLDAVMPHIHDLYAELGIRWGDNPFPVIGRLRAAQAGVPDDIVKDAQRYRWLAAYCRSTPEHWGGRWSIVIEGPVPKTQDSEDDFDAAIDAAMLAAAPTKEGGAV